MPYSFTQIEKQKSVSISGVFASLSFLYFFTIWVIYFLCAHYQPLYQTIVYNRPFQFQSFSLSSHLLALFIALVIAVVHWLFISDGLVQRTLKQLGALDIDPSDERQAMFKNIIEEVCVATGGIGIRGKIIPSMAVNAFSVADDHEAVVGLTKGALYKLTRSQIEAVVGHEAAHIVSGDSQGVTLTAALYESLEGILSIQKNFLIGILPEPDDARRMNRTGARDLGWEMSDDDGFNSIISHLTVRALPLLILIIVINGLLFIVNRLALLMRMFISREREYRADAVAVRLTRDPLSLAQALYIISNRRKTFFNQADCLPTVFIVNPQVSALDEKSGQVADSFSTHPPTTERIRVLLDMARSSESDLPEALTKSYHLEKDLLSKQDKPETFIPWGANTPSDDHAKRCPACSSRLAEEDYEDVQVYRCQSCQGILLKEDELGMIFARRKKTFDARIQAMADAVDQEGPLPLSPVIAIGPSARKFKCDQGECCQKMQLRFFNRFYRVQVDKCLQCGYVWLDQDELEVLQCLYERRAG